MKKNAVLKFVTVALGSFTIISFQNCSQNKFSAVSSGTLTSASLGQNISMFSQVSKSSVPFTGATLAPKPATLTRVAASPVVQITPPQFSTGPGDTGVHTQVEPAVLSVSNSATGGFAVNGSLCNVGMAYVRITGASNIVSGCVTKSGTNDCAISGAGVGNYRTFQSKEFLNSTTVQTSVAASDLPVGSYDAYVYDGMFIGPTNPNPKPIKAGTFQVVDNCGQAASINQTVPQSNNVAPAELPDPVIQYVATFKISNYMQGSVSESEDHSGYLCNQGQAYVTIGGIYQKYAAKACTVPAGSSGCNNIQNFHEFTNDEYYYPTIVHTSSEASIFPLGSYDVYLAYSSKSIMKVATFTVKSCTPPAGCLDVEPKCEGKDYVRRNSCGIETGRWANAPAPYCN